MTVNFASEVPLSYSTGMFNMPYNLTASGRQLYFPSVGTCATDFIALKNPLSWPGFNLRNLGPVAGAITTRPPKTTLFLLLLFYLIRPLNLETITGFLDLFMLFPIPSRRMPELYLKIRLQPLPFKSFTIHPSLITLAFDTI
jgi:hypothetical protein